MYDIDKIRGDFPILERKVFDKPLVYLDNGATAQKPLSVLEAIERLYRRSNANIHRGVHHLSVESTEGYEESREVVRSFINAKESAEIVFTAGATAAINTVAYSYGEKFVGEGDNVVVTEMEHHSNIVPWQLLCERKGAELRVLPFNDKGFLEEQKLESLIDERTRIFAVTEASNVLGTRPNLKRLIDVSHRAGVPVLVDGCQGIVHGGTDVQELNCDFYAFSGHKLYGPTGIGVLYAKREWLEKMPPFLAGGDMVETVKFSGTTFAELPLKFEAGTANYIGAIGLAEAIKYVEGVGVEAIVKHETELLRLAEQKLSQIDGLRIYGEDPTKCAIVSFTVEGTHPTDIGMILDKQGIAIRTGHHCAEPVVDHYGVKGMCRASIGLYNTVEEIEALVRGVELAVSMLR